jgi:hypothetical protein
MECRGQAQTTLLQITKAIGDEWCRSNALEALAPHLGPAQRAEALQAAKAIGDERSRSKTLAALAFHLDPAQRAAVVAEALQAAHAIDKEEDRSRTLAALGAASRPRPARGRARRGPAGGQGDLQ